jgi:predicted double-glycine peptidase
MISWLTYYRTVQAAKADLTTEYNKGKIKFIEIPSIRQTYNYDCGAAALQAVLGYYGYNVREDRLMKRIKMTQAGADFDDILRFVKSFGFDAEIKQDLTLDDIKKYINKKDPLVTSIQAWPKDSKSMDYNDVLSEGHYVVIIGYGDGKIFFEDPALLTRRGYMTEEEFLIRWKDQDKNKTIYKHHALILKGKKPKYDADVIKFTHID